MTLGGTLDTMFCGVSGKSKCIEHQAYEQHIHLLPAFFSGHRQKIDQALRPAVVLIQNSTANCKVDTGGDMSGFIL